MELKNNGKLNFVLGQWRPINENFKGGGHLAMHMLAYKLAERDQNVYICCEPYFKHENIVQLECENSINKSGGDTFKMKSFSYNYNNTVSIYTQVTAGNPFNTKNVARWFMYDSDLPIEETFKDTDCYFIYNNFYVKNTNRLKGKLTIHNFNQDKLWDYGKSRNGYCHIIHKKTPRNYVEILNDYKSIDLTNWRESGGFEYLREQFNKYEYYLTFDDVSYFSLAAAMCGCKVIIIPSEKLKHISPSQFRKQNFNQSVGIAYGFEDLDWCVMTKGYINKHINNLIEIDNNTVDDFINFWKNKLNK